MGLVQQCPVLGFWSSLLGSLLRVEGWSCRGEGGREGGGREVVGLGICREPTIALV